MLEKINSRLTAVLSSLQASMQGRKALLLGRGPCWMQILFLQISLPFPCLALDQRKGEGEGGINHLSHHCFPRCHHCPELPSPVALSFTNTAGALNLWALLCSLEHLPCSDFTIHLLPFADKNFKLIGQHEVLVIFLLLLPKSASALPLLSFCFYIQMRRLSHPILLTPCNLIFFQQTAGSYHQSVQPC